MVQIGKGTARAAYPVATIIFRKQKALGSCTTGVSGLSGGASIEGAFEQRKSHVPTQRPRLSVMMRR